MATYQHRFLNEALSVGALKFGEFTLKSGRVSPYFFNAGQFSSGRSMQVLAQCYSDALVDEMPECDLLFGPAYKGIPLVTATAVTLSDQTGRPVPFAFNRKEKKAHGEGGQFVGAPLKGRVILLDDVITAGTAIREVMGLLKTETDCEVVGCLLALDRQERGEGALSAVQEVEQCYGIPVKSVANLSDLVEFVAHQDALQSILPAVKAYQQAYGTQQVRT